MHPDATHASGGDSPAVGGSFPGSPDGSETSHASESGDLDAARRPAHDAGAGGSSRERDISAMFTQFMNELRGQAANMLASERVGHTLQPTALVNELFLKLSGADPARYANRALFFHTAGEAMRQILIDHARSRRRKKRLGTAVRIPMDVADTGEEPVVLGLDEDELILVHRGMEQIASEEPEAAQIMTMRYFAGLTVAQIAELLEVSARTVFNRLSYGRARLRRILESLGDES